jgi:hypothetical protein
MDRTGQHGLEPIFELLANLIRDDRHMNLIPDLEKK